MVTAIALMSHSMASSQQYSPHPPPHPILLPQANRLPDVNDQMLMRQSLHIRQNFDAANLLRQQQIQDDSTNLLILARDLKTQMDALGDKPVPERLRREAAVIEVLAHDVQIRMTLSVRGD